MANKSVFYSQDVRGGPSVDAMSANEKDAVRDSAPPDPSTEDLDRLRRDYLSNVSHQFRTPLTLIRGYGEYLLGTDGGDPATIQAAARVILDSTDRVIDLVDTLIDVGRLEQVAAQDTLSDDSVDLAQLARSAVRDANTRAEKKHIQIELEVPAVPSWVLGDGALLLQMLRKLLDNAIKYSSASARVVVRCRSDGVWHILEVEDEGIGMAAEHLPKVFDKFYMVEDGLARRGSGAGVGLYLVREIARLHGGMVEVSSEPDRGSVFTVKLPPEVEA